MIRINLIQRFYIYCSSKKKGIPGLFHLFGIESPGLTSSLAIGNYVAQLLHQEGNK